MWGRGLGWDEWGMDENGWEMSIIENINYLRYFDN
jgi:hypothetical protein